MLLRSCCHDVELHSVESRVVDFPLFVYQNRETSNPIPGFGKKRATNSTQEAKHLHSTWQKFIKARVHSYYKNSER